MNSGEIDCLQGAIWFTLLDLKSRYLQVKLEEASKVLTAFMVAPLGFYKCEQMPFGLENVLATSHHHMEIHLGNLQFWCYIIYLSNIIIFAATPKEHLERF